METTQKSFGRTAVRAHRGQRWRRFTIAAVAALVAGGVGVGPMSGGLADGGPVAADGRRNPDVTYRPIADWLENNPHSFNQVGADVGNIAGDLPMLVSFGWNGYGFPKLDGTAGDPSNDEIFGTDPFGFPGGMDSILAEAPHPTRTSGIIRQKQLDDGGVRIAIRAVITSGPISFYDVEDTHGVDGVGGCRPACNDLPGGAGEPEAVFGQDANGRFDYVLSVDLTYTAEGVEAAGGDLDAGINPTIPFMIPAFFGFTTGTDCRPLCDGRRHHRSGHRRRGPRSPVRPPSGHEGDVPLGGYAGACRLRSGPLTESVPGPSRPFRRCR